MKNSAKVFKVSKTGKSILVGYKTSKYAIGYTFGWCANPDGLKLHDDVEDFAPTGTVQCVDEKGNPLTHDDDSPVLQWTFN